MTKPKVLSMGLALAAALLVLPARSEAQVTFSVGIAFPEPPPLVVVSPGIQIVPEYDEEVYFVNGWYWYRHDDGHWFRTHDYHGGWRPAPFVPAGLRRIPPGHYRHYYRDDDGRWRPHDPGEYHAWRDRHPMEERRAWWHDHRHDERVRWEQQHAWREHRDDRRFDGPRPGGPGPRAEPIRRAPEPRPGPGPRAEPIRRDGPGPRAEPRHNDGPGPGNGPRPGRGPRDDRRDHGNGPGRR